MRAFMIFVGCCALSVTSNPQQLGRDAVAANKKDLAGKRYTVAVGTVAAEPGALAVSNAMLGHVEDKFNSDGRVSISGERITKSRPEAANESVWKYGRKTNTDGAAVLQFEYGPTEGKGRVYVWTATPFGPTPDKPTLVEAVDHGNLRPEQISRIAAVIEQASSHGHEVALELFIYTTPPRSHFTVGNSPSQLTDEKGFGNWIGTKEEGPLALSAFNEPDYQPATQQIKVKPDPNQGIVRQDIKFDLKKRPKRKSP
ncbi:MAG: hypothetical protein ACHQIK_18995 [Candidatus Acidiferrales bacterium]